MATNTAASFTNHTGNGTAGPFSISFSYLAESEVDVTVGGVPKTITTHYTFNSATQITFTSGNEPGNGVAIKFQRDTDISAKKVDFADGSVLTETDLDTNADQVIFAQQEILDKLSGIEENATADQTDAEIRTAVENATDSNVFTDADHSKLNAIEASATADQTASEIRTLVESASDSNVFTDADHSKLNAIEDNATADQTAAEIRTLVESATDSNVFTDADHTKLNNIEASATADQTGAEIKSLYEGESDTNAFTDSEKTKLAGIEASATADQSNSEIKTAYEANSDTNAFTDAEKTKLSGIETSADVTDATNVDAAGAVMNSDLDGKGELLVGDGSGDPTAISVGTNNFVLVADSNEPTGVKWATVPAGSGLSNVVEDTTPQLGGNLDVNGNDIVSVSNGNIKLSPNGTGDVQITSDLIVDTTTFVVDSTNNKVGIGTSTPGELLQIFDASGNPTIHVRANNQNTASLKLENDDGDWTISSGTSSYPLNFAVGGSTKLTIDSSGKVGIGTTSPVTAMHIANADDPVTITLQNTDSNTPTDSGGEIIFKGTKTNGDPIFFGGIGGRRRNQASDVTGYLALYRQNGDGSNAAVEAMRIDSSGNVGVGETLPLGKLHVKTADSGATAEVSADELVVEGSNHSGISVLSGTGNAGTINFGDSGDNDIGRIIYNHSTNYMAFNTNASESMRIDSSGSVNIGSTGYGGGGANPRLYVSGTSGRTMKIHGGSATSSLQLTNSTTGEGEDAGFQVAQSGNTAILANAEAEVIILQNKQSVQGSTVLRVSKPQAASNVQSHMIHFLVGGHERGAIAAGSSFGSSPSFTSISDYRVKTNIRNYTDGWNNIKELPVKIFDINKEGEEAKNIKGWIAHEVQTVIPEAVTGIKDAKKEDGSDEYQTLGYGMFMPDVVNALQTAIAKIETLETKVAALEAA